MSVTQRLAWRNLWRHGRRTWLTVAGMVFCNALLVFMISMQLGSYALMIDGTLSVLTGHLQVQDQRFLDEPRMRYTVPDGEALARQLRHATGVSAIAARGSAFALASSEERSFGIQVLGVQPAYEHRVSTLPGLLSRGRYLDDSDAAEIVVGAVLARNLKIDVGDEITLLGSGRDDSFAAGIATVVGIIDSGMTELDRSVAEIPLGYFQATFAMDTDVHALVIKVNDLDHVAPLKTAIAGLLPAASTTVRDWDQLQPGLRQAIQADLFSAFVMYAVLIVLVAFSVLNTQLMSVLERTREFGVMTALGVRPGQLARLVLLETAIMSLLGLLLGCLAGGLLVAWLGQVGFTLEGMEEAMERYNLEGRIYPQLSLASLFGGPLVVFLGGMLAAIYPALRLHTLQPVDAMRAV
ncbi:FtsX-like permease family protein [Seongchinamella sediminis]|uniref:FtsX-like permease family protein n=1 Tax=Seongchinamella sediminis TaxID=2283635 RepID=A0A3L7DYD0_9GAMM|nr:FtsX-like permease family protein [Seongchinamella sediminis]RLQ21011.1 FtsX-like permease family protein [Seongchinamella sediminis]